jgi:hypothetical protein
MPFAFGTAERVGIITMELGAQMLVDVANSCKSSTTVGYRADVCLYNTIPCIRCDQNFEDLLNPFLLPHHQNVVILVIRIYLPDAIGVGDGLLGRARNQIIGIPPDNCVGDLPQTLEFEMMGYS